MGGPRRKLLKPSVVAGALSSGRQIDSFVDYLRSECHLSENTVAAYRRDRAAEAAGRQASGADPWRIPLSIGSGPHFYVGLDSDEIRPITLEDFVEGLLLCMTHPAAIGESLNIGNARAVVTVYGLAQTIVRVLGSKSPIKFQQKEYVDVELRVPGVSKAKRLLGFEAKIDLDEGIRRTGDFTFSISRFPLPVALSK